MPPSKILSYSVASGLGHGAWRSAPARFCPCSRASTPGGRASARPPPFCIPARPSTYWPSCSPPASWAGSWAWPGPSGPSCSRCITGLLMAFFFRRDEAKRAGRRARCICPRRKPPAVQPGPGGHVHAHPGFDPHLRGLCPPGRGRARGSVGGHLRGQVVASPPGF